jgi:DNA-binding transcriptional ArsR family regulator
MGKWGGVDMSETNEAVTDLELIQGNAKRASTLLKAMSNQHRLLILCQLVPGEKCVGELEKIVGLSQSALSQHLARLRRDDLVSTRREAQTIHYSLAGEEASAVIETLYGLYCGREAILSFGGEKAAVAI